MWQFSHTLNTRGIIMRTLLTLLVILFACNSYAQLSIDNPVYTVENRTYTLLNIDDMGKATIRLTEYHNGKILKTGLYFDGKLDGTWNLYDENGNLTTSVVYKYGDKIKYTTITDKEKMVVRYVNNKPVTISTEVSLASN